MKKVCIGLVAALLVFALSACNGQSTPPASTNPPGSEAAASSSSQLQSEPAESIYAAPIEEVIVTAPDGAEFHFSAAQQNVITQQVNDAIAKYKSGEYPVTPASDATDFVPFARYWPEGVPYPEALSPADIHYTSEGFEMYGVGATVELPDQY